MCDIADRLNSDNVDDRLEAVVQLCMQHNSERYTIENAHPVLPSYVHVHTRASYGNEVPGIGSVAQLMWAAWQNKAQSVAIIEHESTLHIDEALQVYDMLKSLVGADFSLVLGVEYKAPIDEDALPGEAARVFRKSMLEAWGQGDAAWVVGMGVQKRTPALDALTRVFRKAKYERGKTQLELLKTIYPLPSSIELDEWATEEGNITDRQLCHGAAALIEKDDQRVHHLAKEMRAQFGNGKPAYVPFSKSLPNYAELIQSLKKLSLVPSCTAQLSGDALQKNIPTMKAWGMEALDIAGIEPDDPEADAKVNCVIEAAESLGWHLFAGSDYRGMGTGWSEKQSWMSHPLAIETMQRLCVRGV